MYTSKVGRKKKSPDELMVNINTKVPPDVYKEVESIAAAQDRLISYVGRKLILRGLIAYRRDGLLDDMEEMERIRNYERMARIFEEEGHPVEFIDDPHVRKTG